MALTAFLRAQAIFPMIPGSIVRVVVLAHLICVPLWTQASKDSPARWKPLFDGSSLQGWRETPFSGRGKVRVENGAIVLGKGLLTGITWTEVFPRFNYEVRLQAMRVDGYDFFAGITFPVHDSFCSWINGGWGGMVVGLSSLDDMDAAENDTSIRRNFESGHWYAFRLRVTEDRIQAWIDDEAVIDAYIGSRMVGLRPGEIELSKPLGIASYSTTAKLRKLEYRLLETSGN
jgi:hypothetical protein